MLFKTYLGTGILASGVTATTLQWHDHIMACSTPQPTEEQKAVAKEFSLQEAASRSSGLTMQADINVEVYLHSIASTESDLLSEATLQEQFKVLVTDFAPSGIKFHLASITKAVNSTWAKDGDEQGMKQALRKGNYRDLNLYFLKDLNGGYCYLPMNAPKGSTEFLLDGCSIEAGRVTGGANPYFRLGKTAVHETGHWFGLLHTFEGGCIGEGDFVEDTPAQAGSSFGCPIGRNSCSAPGLDPIHNYMDYSDQACVREFTPGQRDRMISYWNRYRSGR